MCICLLQYNVLHLLEGQLLKSEYFQHLSYFPRGQRLDKAFFAEMKGVLIWGLTGKTKSLRFGLSDSPPTDEDSLTSIDSLAPYDVPTMEHFLKLITHMQGCLSRLFISLFRLFTWFSADLNEEAPEYCVAAGGMYFTRFLHF